MESRRMQNQKGTNRMKRKLVIWAAMCFLIAAGLATGMAWADICSDNPGLCSGLPCAKAGYCCPTGNQGSRGTCRIECSGSPYPSGTYNCTTVDCWWKECTNTCGNGCVPGLDDDYTDVCGSGGNCNGVWLGGGGAYPPGGGGTTGICCESCSNNDWFCWMFCGWCNGQLPMWP